jgi:RNA polymerase sigma factor (sigma-70 family)
MSDEASFSTWYESQHPRLFVSMVALSGSTDLAAEATDEAFARAFAHWQRVSTMSSPGGWTYRVAVNVLRRRSRRRSAERRLLHRFVTDVVPEPAGEVWELVRRLPDRQRTAVVLRYVGDLTEPEIARVMKVTRGTVASTLAAARRALGRALAEPDTVEEST